MLIGMIIITIMSATGPAKPVGRPEPAQLRGNASLLDDAVASNELLKGGRELRIRHGDQIYRLCHTRNDKLILIK